MLYKWFIWVQNKILNVQSPFLSHQAFMLICCKDKNFYPITKGYETYWNYQINFQKLHSKLYLRQTLCNMEICLMHEDFKILKIFNTVNHLRQNTVYDDNYFDPNWFCLRAYCICWLTYCRSINTQT